uniref:Uncharacterized protein n=1 Tax=Anguilla anguilla TaxID=7936 RepID=A0A0E9URV2_ANGAN
MRWVKALARWYKITQ